MALGEHQWAGIVGIGINVVTKLEEFPVEIRRQVISLAQCGGRVWTVAEVLESVLEHLGRAMMACREGNAAGSRDNLVPGSWIGCAGWMHYAGGGWWSRWMEKRCRAWLRESGEQGELLVRRSGEEKAIAVEMGTVVSVDAVRVRG